MKRPYSTRYTHLFLMGEGGPVWLQYTGVVRVQFQPRGILHIRGMLPFRSDLLELRDGVIFELTYNHWGPSGDYGHALPLFRFSNCKIINRHIKNAVSCSDDHYLFVEVVFECDIEIPNWEAS